MSNVNAGAPDASVLRMIQAARAAGADGRESESDQLLARAAQLSPGHPAVLNELGLRMMQRGDAKNARELFLRATQADQGHPSLWSNLASSCYSLGLPQEAMEAVERALALEPRHLASLLQKGALMDARGDLRNAARAYRNALATLPPGVAPPPTVAAMVERARESVQADNVLLAAALDERLAPIRERHGGGAHRRVDRCIEFITGKREHYNPQPTFMHFPEIPAVEFFEREQFPWLDEIEAASDAIRDELTGVLVADRAGLEPYIAYPDGVPLDRWKELNKSRRWSAYFLWNQGVAQPAHLARCPRTAEILKTAPQCDVAGRGPTAFYSILDAQTAIPPHTGVTNTRLTVHLPLIVPPGCGFRVGGETREWIPGKAWVFDDTIEHEAWNDSDEVRVILIIDTWNPYLTHAERELVAALLNGVTDYYRDQAAPA